MQSLHTDGDYLIALRMFQSRPSTDCNHSYWAVFKAAHLKLSKNKCPICECSLNGSISRASAHGTTTLSPTIDHYRPKDPAFYPLLKCDHENYLLMCSDCNNNYKGNKFPLHHSTPSRNTTATNTRSITNEKPLIVNPIYDDVLNLFKLSFKQTTSGRKVLELIPLYDEVTNSYLHEKAKTTIKLFGLGKCEEDVHPNSNIHNCRINILSMHFNKFHNFIVALKNKDLTKAYHIAKTNNLEEYGFFNFIQKKLYQDLIP